MNLLVLGRGGQLARALTKAGAEPGLGEDQVDLAVPGQAAAAIRKRAPKVVINAAAYTAVDAAEGDRDTAFRVNGEAVGEIARAAHKAGAALIHISTDYVFDGAKQEPYVETDPVNPLNVYGASKLAGERAALAEMRRCVILRTSWVYAPWGRNFIATMLNAARTRDRLQIVADQWGRPTSAQDLAACCMAVARTVEAAPDSAAIWGIHHYSGGGEATTWAGLAAAIFAAAKPYGIPTPAIDEVPTSAFPTPALRPKNSMLDCARLTETFGIVPLPWRNALARTLAQMAESGKI